MRYSWRLLWLVLLGLCSGVVMAAGPREVAVPDRSLWPQELNSPQAFDLASRAEILSFAHQLAESENMSDSDLSIALHLRHIDRTSIDLLRGKWWQRLLHNYQLASMACKDDAHFCAPTADLAQFRKSALTFTSVPEPAYTRWYEDAQHFDRLYLDELLRLASLFPHISSEIDTYSAQETIDGNLQDRQFLLTLDDGPTPLGGNTDTTLKMLHELDLHPQFFALGQNLQNRINATSTEAVENLYTGMCVGAHGWTHFPHVRAGWEASIEKTLTLIHDTMPQSYEPLFRPPYGQRLANSEAYFKEHGVRVVLWNIDSQDWNRKISSEQARQRVLSLMLLWRHGLILFHDIHPKATVAIPWLLQQTKQAGVEWMDCHEVARSLTSRQN